jgi:hypothetical protein
MLSGDGVTNCLFYQICWKNLLWIEIHHVMDKEHRDNHEISTCINLAQWGGGGDGFHILKGHTVNETKPATMTYLKNFKQLDDQRQ